MGDFHTQPEGAEVRWYVEAFAPPILALILTPFLVMFIFWSVRP